MKVESLLAEPSALTRPRALFMTAMMVLVLTATFVASASAQWAPTGAMNTARRAHTATLLPSGKVLVAGGSIPAYTDSGGQLHDTTSSAELFDPVTGTWSVSGALVTPHAGHSAVLLQNGKVLIVGGYVSGEGPVASPEVYDPATGTFSPTGDLRIPRSDASVTLLADGRVLVDGGSYTTILRSSEIYDPATGTWQETGTLSVARTWHAAVRLNDGRVLVAGGLEDTKFIVNTTTFTFTDTAEIYDPATGSWSMAPPIAFARSSRAATLLANGKALIVGGFSSGPRPTSYATAELYDPVTGWSVTGNLNVPREAHAATLLPNGDVLVTGGINHVIVMSDTTPQIPLDSNDYLSSVEQYSAATGTWSLAQSMATKRVGHTATRLADGRVLVAGGDYGLGYTLASAELYGTASAPQANIGPGFTGAWYDPAQSGHGLFIEVLPGNRMLVAWLAFSPTGEQAWFVGAGGYIGSTATIGAMVQPTGGRWIPNFDATKIVNNAWGSLTLTFTDCNHGRVDFNSTLGYGSGGMNLTRLTELAGLSCTTIPLPPQ